MTPIKLMTIYHGAKHSFECDYRIVMGSEEFEWCHMGGRWETTRQGISKWQQLDNPSHTGWSVGNARIIYYAFMTNDRILIILLGPT